MRAAAWWVLFSNSKRRIKMAEKKDSNLYGKVPQANNPPSDAPEVTCTTAKDCPCAKCCSYRQTKNTWGIAEHDGSSL
jgi:hypothetical protein